MTKTKSKAAAWAAEVSGHEFKNAGLLKDALTHTSVAGKASYERLEFLGDRVLGVVIANWVFHEFPQDAEGRLATRFAHLVRRETLADVARDIALGAHITLANSARGEGAHEKDSVLADCCEAFIGALYLDGGLEAAENFIRRHWQTRLNTKAKVRKDAKTRLQEWAQGRGLPLPEYAEMGRSGPDHSPEFIIRVTVKGFDAAEAIGVSKRDAQQKAAEALLSQLPGQG